MTQTIEQLTARVRELEAENARLNSSPTIEACRQMIRDKAVIEASTLHEQLAAEQLNNKLLRDALENHSGNYKLSKAECSVINELIDKSASTEALDAYVAAKVKEAGKFDMWKTNPYTKVLETSIKQLTKQRDLAVDALKNCRLLAARHRKEEWAGHIMRFCKDAGLSGSPIRNDAIKKSEAK